MKNIVTKQFSILSDFMYVYGFMRDIYSKDWCNGVPAPFLEYAFYSFSYWMDLSYTYKNRIWLDNGEIVGFCFYTDPVTDIYFSLKPGYEEIAPEMIAYADRYMPHLDGNIQFILFQGQQALMTAADLAGYKQISQFREWVYDFDQPLDYPLPDGFHFVNPEDHDMDKVSECCWKGFDHEAQEGPWNYQYIHNNHLLQVAPHATPEYPVAVANDRGEYVCWAGMWWVPENQLAYLEPFCVVPEYRRTGIASAALSELYRRMKPLGAAYMTGGDNDFYQKMGFKPMVTWTFWKKQ